MCSVYFRSVVVCPLSISQGWLFKKKKNRKNCVLDVLMEYFVPRLFFQIRVCGKQCSLR